MVLALLVCALFLFADGRTMPIILWDESRNIVNALEMLRTGPSLITTYGFQPDLWNTKPPLLIWLMSGSAALFGPSEWALRLPSAVAALGTLLLVMLFVRRITGSRVTALLASGYLLLSPGFFGEHGARTADYDALLLFFVTGYLLLLFFMIHRVRPDRFSLLLSALLIACAALTKSTAGVAPGIGIVAYLFLVRRRSRLWSVRYVAMGILAAAPLCAFLLVREAQAPGYLQAALFNDLIGRFQETLVRHQGLPWYDPRALAYYPQSLITGWFFAGPILLATPFVLKAVRGKSRVALIYALVVAGAFLAVIGLSSSRLLHYALPVYPLLAVAAAIVSRGAFETLLKRGSARSAGRALAIAVLLLAPLIVNAMLWRYQRFPERLSYAQARYGELFTSLAARGISEATAIDNGFVLIGKPHYVPLLSAYRLMWRERGLIVHHRTGAPMSGDRGVFVSCDPAMAAALLRQEPDIGGVPGCAAIRRTPR